MDKGILDQLREELAAEEKRISGKKRRRRRVRIAVILLLLLLTGFLFRVILGIDVVSGTSMSPALREGDWIVYLRTFGEINAGDLVVFPLGEEELVKRVAALPGDTVEFDEEGKNVVVNGKILRYAGENMSGGQGERKGLTVLDGYLFVLGDNLDMSVDSRSSEVGTIPLESIRGRVILTLRPGG